MLTDHGIFMFRHPLLVLSRVDLVILIGCWVSCIGRCDGARYLNVACMGPHPSRVLRRIFGAAP